MTLMPASERFARLLEASRTKRITVALRVVEVGALELVALGHAGEDIATITDAAICPCEVQPAPVFDCGDVPVLTLDPDSHQRVKVETLRLIREQRMVLPFPLCYFVFISKRNTIIVRAVQSGPGEQITLDHFSHEQGHPWRYCGVEVLTQALGIPDGEIGTVDRVQFANEATGNRMRIEASQACGYAIVMATLLLDPKIVKRPGEGPPKVLRIKVSNRLFPFPDVVKIDLSGFRYEPPVAPRQPTGQTKSPHDRRATLRTNWRTGVKDIPVRASKVRGGAGAPRNYVVKS